MFCKADVIQHFDYFKERVLFFDILFPDIQEPEDLCDFIL